jgi:hypothetical protein
MEEWDEDYFNMETQAYIEVTPQNGGEFQFGLVTGSIDGYLEDNNGKSVSLLLGMALTKWMKLADGFSSAAKIE